MQALRSNKDRFAGGVFQETTNGSYNDGSLSMGF